MKKFVLFMAMILVAIPFTACRVEKTGDDTYQVEVPTPEAERAAQQAGAKAREVGQEIKEEAKELGGKVREGTREAGQKTGTAVEEAGKEMREHSKPGDQP
jgi:hypothetical protein